MSADPVHLYAALLDVLAYREQLDQDRHTGTLAFQEKLLRALAVFERVNESVFRVNAISDTIILTCNTHTDFPQFLSLLKNVFVAFLRQGLFVRGGVAYSRHFQNRYLTYSHAVARAYEIESRLSVYPRIVIDENIVQMYTIGTGLPLIHGRGLLCRNNGVYFLNILDTTNWPEVHRLAQTLYTDMARSLRGNETAAMKHIMFERYIMASRHATARTGGYVERIEEV